MGYVKFTPYLCACALIACSLSLLGGTTLQAGSAAQATGSASQLATKAVGAPGVDCLAQAGATLAATQAATEADMIATASVTPVIDVTEEASAPLHFVSFLPTDLRFNPDPEKPVAMIMVFSLVFRNGLGQALHIESPKFKLAINGVPWGNLSSTDFQTGQMLAHAEQGIVLQSLTLFNRIAPEQQAVVPCLKAHLPVDLALTGTIDAFPGDNMQPVQVSMVTRQVIIRERR